MLREAVRRASGLSDERREVGYSVERRMGGLREGREKTGPEC